MNNFLGFKFKALKSGVFPANYERMSVDIETSATFSLNVGVFVGKGINGTLEIHTPITASVISAGYITTGGEFSEQLKILLPSIDVNRAVLAQSGIDIETNLNAAILVDFYERARVPILITEDVEVGASVNTANHYSVLPIAIAHAIQSGASTGNVDYTNGETRTVCLFTANANIVNSITTVSAVVGELLRMTASTEKYTAHDIKAVEQQTASLTATITIYHDALLGDYKEFTLGSLKDKTIGDLILIA